MSTETTDTAAQYSLADLQAQYEDMEDRLAAVETLVDDADDPPKMTVIAINGTLDMAYPTLILSSMAAAFDWDVTVFASFWALDMLHKEKSKKLKMSAVGNPALGVPSILGVMPGMNGVATRMMKKKIADVGTESIDQLIQRALDNGVRFLACQMTADVMGYEEDDFIEGVETGVGAATALLDMEDSDIQLVI
ncbi:MAG: DsrE/DsrF/DrsH-like family protein [Halobacteriales archaeon]|nr:DsrE/DsrF/DrsH-like family protein [Halobacteriales archaeon]